MAQTREQHGKSTGTKKTQTLNNMSKYNGTSCYIQLHTPPGQVQLHTPTHSTLGGSPPASSGEGTLHQDKINYRSLYPFLSSFYDEDHEPSGLEVGMSSTTNLMAKTDDDLGIEARATPHPGEGIK